MAKQSKDDLIKLLSDAGVELTGEEKVKDLVALAEEHNLISTEDGDEDVADDQDTVVDTATKVKNPTEVVLSNKPLPTPTKQAEESVTFTMNDKVVTTRVFSLEEHGENFLELANEFAVSNQSKVLGRVDS